MWFRYKTLLFFAFLAAVLAGCENVNGPDRTVTVENATGIAQGVAFDIRGEGRKEFSVPPDSSFSFSFTGTYTKEELPPPYVWNSVSEDHWKIVEAPQKEYSISNGLIRDVVLKDSLSAGFSVSVPASNSAKTNIYIRVKHDFYLTDNSGTPVDENLYDIIINPENSSITIASLSSAEN